MMTTHEINPVLTRPRDSQEFATQAEPFRRELQVHCYRMLGSLQDAEDLVQETLLRAWLKLDTFEGRASFRAWLYKIATNACLDALDRRPRRVLPQTYSPPTSLDAPPAAPILEPIWIEPIPDDYLDGIQADPEARYDARESITLAFLAALQVLPPRQRAVLVLRDVLDWSAEETAQLLDITLSAANSVLHRARVAMANHYRGVGLESLRTFENDPATQDLLARYVHAWEAANVDELVSLLQEDASFPMPPSPEWYQGRPAIRAFILARILNGDARGRWRLVPTHANGQPAFAWYIHVPETNSYHAFGLHVVTLNPETGLISNAMTFMNPALLEKFKLPPALEV